MISKLAKAKNNWFFKIISIAVAISFISLFGVTGYISSASQNKTVVNVGGIKTTQSEFSYRLQRELSAIKGLTGDDFEISDELRNSLADNVLRQIVDENVLDKTIEKHDIYFPKAFVQQIIFSRPEFANPVNGQFHPDLFKRYLSSVGMSEAQYVATIKRIMAQKILVSDLVQEFEVPQILVEAIHKMDNQRKIFKYVTINPQDIILDRKISDDEIKTYYEDFSENFMLPETREVELLFIPNDTILEKYVTSDDMVKNYFDEHKKEFNQPEKRNVQQMLFTDKATAEKAFDLLKSGQSFVNVAKEMKAENAQEPTLGVVAEDELADVLAQNVFEMKVNEPRLIEVADSWQIVNVLAIIPAKEATFAEVKTEISELLKNENLYEALREAKADIDDATNDGKTLAEIGASFNVKPVIMSNIEEEQIVSDAPVSLQNLDFNELVFSYGADEFSSAEEFDDGVAVIKIIKITDSHLPELDSIKDKIIELWTVQEKNALARELAENIVGDTEDGSELATVAKTRQLEVLRSAPVSRNETFSGLTESEINELFLAENGAVKLFERSGNSYILATPVETVNYQEELTSDKQQDIKNRAKSLIFSDMQKATLDSYAEDYKIKIDYDLAGFSE